MSEKMVAKNSIIQISKISRTQYIRMLIKEMRMIKGQVESDCFREHVDRGHAFFQSGDFESAKGCYLLAYSSAFFRADIEEIGLRMVYMSPNDAWTKELLSHLGTTAKDHSDYYTLGILYKSMPGGKRQARKYFETALRLAKVGWARMDIKKELEKLK